MMTRAYLIVLSIALVVLQGCVALKTFPNAARAGDTITVALGSIEGANKNNIKIYYNSDDGTSHVNLELPIRSVFNLEADKTSNLNLQPAIFGIGRFRADVITLASAHSAWLTVAVIDLPTDLQVGTGSINVEFTSADVIPVNLSVPANANTDADPNNDIVIGLEIIPGTPAVTPNPFEYVANNTTARTGDLAALEPSKQVVLRSPRITDSNYNATATKVHAAEFVFTVQLHNTLDANYVVPTEGLMVIRDENRFDYVQGANPALGTTTAAQTQLSWSKSGDIVTVNIISPTGELLDNLIRFSLVPAPTNDFTVMPTLDTWRYFDASGNEISGMTPELVPLNF